MITIRVNGFINHLKIYITIYKMTNTFHFINGQHANNIPEFVNVFRNLSFDIIEHHYNHLFSWFQDNIKDESIITEINELYNKNLVINLFRTNLLDILYQRFNIVPIWTINDAPF